MTSTEDQTSSILGEYETVFYAVEDAVVFMDVDDDSFRYRRINPAYTRMTGLTIHELAGHTPRELMGDQVGEEIEMYCREAVKSRALVRYTSERVYSGRTIVINVSVQPVVREDRVVALVLTARDITEAKKQQDELRATNDMLNALIQSSPLAVVGLDIEGHVVIWSSQAERMYGWTSGEVLGQPAPMNPPGSEAQVSGLRQRVLCGEVVTGLEVERVRRDGAKISIRGAMAPIRGSDGTITGYLAIAEDITKQKQAEEALEESRKRLRETNQTLTAIIDCAPLALMTLDAKGRITRWNPSAESLYGWSEAEVIGRPNPAIPPSTLGDMLARRKRVLRGDILTGLVSERQRKDGRLISVRGSMAPLRDTAGQVIGHVAFSEDISSQQRAEEALLESERRYRSLVETVHDVVCDIDATGTFKYVSPQARRVLGYLPTELVGSRLFDHMDPREAKRVGDRWETTVLAQEAFTFFEFNMTHKENRTLIVQMDANPVFARDNEFSGYTVVLRDVTARKQDEEEVHFLSFHDKLTGLYNRAYFEEYLMHVDTPRQLPISLIMGDVNGLKLTNDVFGHAQGDALLQQVAAILTSTCRAEDVIARWGGDEFAIILPGTSAEAVEAACDRIRRACSQAQGAPIRTSVALGAATKEFPKEDMNWVLGQAEDRMYSSKLTEGNAIRDSILADMVGMLDTNRYELREHTRRLEVLARHLGAKLGLAPDVMKQLDQFAIFHDIGKIAIPEDILSRIGSLSDEEKRVLSKHVEIGYRLARATPELQNIAEAILSHHERWNGSGFPRSLSGEQIPLIARILSVVNTYDRRRRRMDSEHALQEVMRRANTVHDPSVVQVFVDMIRSEGDPQEIREP